MNQPKRPRPRCGQTAPHKLLLDQIVRCCDSRVCYYQKPLNPQYDGQNRQVQHYKCTYLG